MTKVLKKWIAPKDFYKKVFLISVPLALQQLLNSAMGIADSMMVSWIGQVTAVGTAAQIENLMMTVGFGVASGAGIFMSQFFGKRDLKSEKKAFCLGVILSLINALVCVAASVFFGRQLMRFYIPDPTVIESALQYLMIAMISYLPGALITMFSFAYRCIQKTHVPMLIGLVSMAMNIALNYCLIFGHFGFPQMGVQGAALATLIAQTTGLVIHIVYAYKSKQSFIGTPREMFALSSDFVQPILRRAYPLVLNELFFGFGNTLYIRAFGRLGTEAMDAYYVGNPDFVQPILRRAYPLVLNELFFGFGNTLYIRAFGRLGTEAMDAYYVGNQISNMFFFIVQGLNSANGAILGASLGQGDLELAKRQGNWFVALAVVLSAVSSLLILGFAHPMVDLFGLQNANVVQEAVLIVRIFSIRISLRMFNVLVFSALRAGGDSKFLAFLDAGIMWIVGLPLAFILVEGLHFTSIALVFLIIQVDQLVRMVIGLKRYFKGAWLIDLTQEVKTA